MMPLSIPAVAILLMSAPSLARDGKPPRLAVENAAIVDDIVVMGTVPGTADQNRGITEPISSQPISLLEATGGLVTDLGDGGEDGSRGTVASELERVARALQINR
jgi:hypothetical protein